uniref:Uncharacterized protein n=1 Tax=Daphnia galeata TaxID=27404 RepID=A0A8J2WKM6_9CRUS|nr:unnamed protein product [Daphnia galeata]
MNSLILLPLIVAATVMAAPLNQDTPANTYLMNTHYPAFNYPMRQYGLDDGESLFRQGSVPGIVIIAQQLAAALSNFQLYYTVQKWNAIFCLLDSSCPEVILPPVSPFETTTTTTAAPTSSRTA